MNRICIWSILFSIVVSVASGTASLAQTKVLPKRTAEHARESSRKETERMRESERRRQLEHEADKQRERERLREHEHSTRLDRAKDVSGEVANGSRPWGSELTRFILESPENTKWKGFREHLLAFDAHFNTRGVRPTEAEVHRWIEHHVSTEPVRQANFRGTLREVSVVQMLRAEGHTEVKWNREPEPIHVSVEGRQINLGERIIDIIDRDPQKQQVTYFEIKNADLNKAFRQHEIKRLEERTSVTELVKVADPNGTVNVSREFRELVKDMVLVERDKRQIEWVANSAPANFTTTLARYGIRLHLVH